MKLSILVLVPSMCFFANSKADFLYNADSFRLGGAPTGADVTPMNLSSPGDSVRILGSGFGDGGDISRETIYVHNPTAGNQLWMIYRGLYDSGGPHAFGIMSWTDREIDLQVVPGLGSSLGSFIELRTYSNATDDHVGTTIIGDLIYVVPEPSSVVLVIAGGLSLLIKKHRGVNDLDASIG